MKVVILAGGLGTRISEESCFKPKPMIEIGGQPILWHIMKYYSSFGFHDFVICCGYKGHVIKEYFADYYLHRSDVTFDFSAVPTPERYCGNVSPTGPRACYDEAKRFGETMCALFARKYQVPIGVVRPFNNYGPGMRLDDRRVPADFARHVLNREDITLLSDGSPTRTFCYVADAAAGYLKAMLHGAYDYFNIGIEEPEISMAELAEIYQAAGRELFGYAGSVRRGVSEDREYLTDNPQRRCPDISKARTILGYRPEIPVAEGVRRFLRFWEEELA